MSHTENQAGTVPAPGPVQLRISEKLTDALQPLYLDVVNESHRHAVPPGSESHFKVTIVAAGFADLGRVARHRRVHQLLESELSGSVHALALHLYTGTEWQARFGQIPPSPDCLGGSRVDV